MDKVEYRYPPEIFLVKESKPAFSGSKTEDILNWALSLDESLDRCHIQLDTVQFWIIENKKVPE